MQLDPEPTPHQLATRVAVLEERLAGIATARDLQATEYERRLEALNHGHAEIVASQEKYLAKDIYEQRNQRLESETAGLRTYVDQRFTDLERRTTDAANAISSKHDALVERVIALERITGQVAVNTSVIATQQIRIDVIEKGTIKLYTVGSILAAGAGVITSLILKYIA